MQGRKR